MSASEEVDAVVLRLDDFRCHAIARGSVKAIPVLIDDNLPLETGYAMIEPSSGKEDTPKSFVYIKRITVTQVCFLTPRDASICGYSSLETLVEVLSIQYGGLLSHAEDLAILEFDKSESMAEAPT